MRQRIRLAMHDKEHGGMSAQIEVNETFIGGKARSMQADKRAARIKGTGPAGRAAVMGLRDRCGPDGHSAVTLKMVPNTRRRHPCPEVRARVVPGAEVMTDAPPFCAGLGGAYIHRVIDHAEKHVEGTVATGGLEIFWSPLKRASKGTCISVEPFHLFRYPDEEALRFNTCGMEDGQRFPRVLGKLSRRRHTYAQPTGKQQGCPA